MLHRRVVLGLPVLRLSLNFCTVLLFILCNSGRRFLTVLLFTLWFPLVFLLRPFHLSVRLVAVRWVMSHVTLFLAAGLLDRRHSY